LNLNQKVNIPPQIMVRQVGEDSVLLDLVTGTYYGLDPLGTRIWAMLAKGDSLQQVHDAVVAEYDVPSNQLLNDLDALMQDLVGRKLVELTG